MRLRRLGWEQSEAVVRWCVQKVKEGGLAKSAGKRPRPEESGLQVSTEDEVTRGGVCTCDFTSWTGTW